MRALQTTDDQDYPYGKLAIRNRVSVLLSGDLAMPINDSKLPKDTAQDAIMEAIRRYGARCLERGAASGTPRGVDALISESEAYAVVDELIEKALRSAEQSFDLTGDPHGQALALRSFDTPSKDEVTAAAEAEFPGSINARDGFRMGVAWAVARGTQQASGEEPEPAEYLELRHLCRQLLSAMETPTITRAEIDSIKREIGAIIYE